MRILGRLFTVAVVATLAALMIAGSIATATSTVVVTPTNLNGWEISNYDAATATASGNTTTSGTHGEFVNGPATPPAGVGSFHQAIGTDGNDAQRIRTSNYNGALLSTLTDISYSTYVTNPNNTAQATYIQLFVDLNGDGGTDDILFFEPVYQSGLYTTLPYSSSVPNQCGINSACVTPNTWQTWDADAGGWWSLNESAGGPPLTTLASYAAQHPGAKLITSSAAFRLTAGFGGPTWNSFDGNVDKVTINGTTFDFELRATASFAGQCKNGGWQTLQRQNGTTFKNQGDCISYTNNGK